MNRPSIPIVNVGKRVRRFQQVVNTIAKHGFGEILTRIRIWEACNIERRILRRECKLSPELTPAQRIRLAIEELGPTFIKLGQMLSTRPDLVPPEIIVELKKLQYAVHFVPVDIIKGIIESELGRPINEIFDSFDETPLAAASLAQVHRAVYKGNQVVLKVQRPNVVEVTEIDVEIMRSLADLAERYSPRLYLINSVGLVREFAQQIKKELDFLMEAHNMIRFAEISPMMRPFIFLKFIWICAPNAWSPWNTWTASISRIPRGSLMKATILNLLPNEEVFSDSKLFSNMDFSMPTRTRAISSCFRATSSAWWISA